MAFRACWRPSEIDRSMYCGAKRNCALMPESRSRSACTSFRGSPLALDTAEMHSEIWWRIGVCRASRTRHRDDWAAGDGLLPVEFGRHQKLAIALTGKKIM